MDFDLKNFTLAICVTVFVIVATKILWPFFFQNTAQVPLQIPTASDLSSSSTCNEGRLPVSEKQKQQEQLKNQGNDALAKQQNYRKAIEFYTQAINVNPNCEAAAAIYSNRSLCYFNLGRFIRALEDAEAACLCRPGWGKAYFRYALAAEQLDEWEKAVEGYEKFLKYEKEQNVDEIKNKLNAAKAALKKALVKKKEKLERGENGRRSLAAIRNETERRAQATGLLDLSLQLLEEEEVRASIEFAYLDYREYTFQGQKKRGYALCKCAAGIMKGNSEKTDMKGLKILKFLIEELGKRRIPVECKETKDSPFSVACVTRFCKYTSPNLLTALVDSKKFDVNFADRDGYTPLARLLDIATDDPITKRKDFLTANKIPVDSMIEAAEILLKGGAKLTTSCSHVIAPLVSCVEHPRLIELLLRYCPPNDDAALHAVSFTPMKYMGQETRVEFTPLLAAFCYRSYDSFKLIHERGGKLPPAEKNKKGVANYASGFQTIWWALEEVPQDLQPTMETMLSEVLEQMKRQQLPMIVSSPMNPHDFSHKLTATFAFTAIERRVAPRFLRHVLEADPLALREPAKYEGKNDLWRIIRYIEIYFLVPTMLGVYEVTKKKDLDELLEIAKVAFDVMIEHNVVNFLEYNGREYEPFTSSYSQSPFGKPSFLEMMNFLKNHKTNSNVLRNYLTEIYNFVVGKMKAKLGNEIVETAIRNIRKSYQ